MDATTAYLLIASAFFLGFVLGHVKAGKPLAPPSPPDAAALEAARPILERDGKIAAIKAYRERTGVGLRDAKSAIDSLG